MIPRALLDDPDLADFLLVEEAGLRVLVRKRYRHLVDRLTNAGAAGSIGVVRGGRQAHPVVELPEGERAVIRRYRRGGALRHLNRDRYFLGHRAFAELRATERARAGGVRVPEVLAAAERRRIVGYTATLATRWIAAGTELAAWLVAHSPDERERVLRLAGEQLGRMHAAGVAHPDVNLRNLLVSPNAGGPEVYVLDFDRARVRADAVPPRRRARDLRRLARSARKLHDPVDAAGWRALREGYGANWPSGLSLG